MLKKLAPARLLLLLIVTVTSAAAQGVTNDARLKEVDDYAARALQDWRVPGMAVAVVKDDRVVLAKGYGVRELGKAEKVDAETLFAIASNSKAFTAAALAVLVDEGRLKWDDPAAKYLPGFELYDPYATREITVRDLVSHRSGLATFGGDLLWYETTYSRDEVLRRIRHLKPVSSFRSRYGYQNVMFLAAGEVVESWDEFVRERFFAPLGMKHTNTTVTAFRPGANVAAPHNEKGGTLHAITYANVDNVGPAASINSCVADLAEWVRLQLGRGTYAGKRVFSAAASWEMLGWFLSDYHGRKVVSHGGGLDGMISQTALMPEENLGVVVLTNSETPLASLLVNKVFDVFLGVPKRDWSAEALERAKKAKEAAEAEEAKVEAARVKDTKPSLALERYAGRSRPRAASWFCASPPRRTSSAIWSTGTTTRSA
jgi:CubicO group peptidase (beta-lactamase class C family)